MERTIKHIGRSDLTKMGEIELRQPFPTPVIDNVNPFILLHHYGPYEINAGSNPFDLGPHPHRGFEPITFLFQGEQLHRDSLGNEEVVKAGDVQWTTAGNGIIHAEGPTKEFVQKGGKLEGIQLWLNLPQSKKMMLPNYQHVKAEEMPVFKSPDGKFNISVVAGELESKIGRIETQTEVNAFIVDAEANGTFTFKISPSHEALVYLLHGKIDSLGKVLEEGKNQMLTYNKDGDSFTVNSLEKSKLLILSGEPINEPIATYGPFVMNKQSELIEAMNDYSVGKMGSLK